MQFTPEDGRVLGALLYLDRFILFGLTRLAASMLCKTPPSKDGVSGWPVLFILGFANVYGNTGAHGAGYVNSFDKVTFHAGWLVALDVSQ